MPQALVISVRLHDDRYHGAGEWPPAPARLFQALVAGVGISGPIGMAEQVALQWLEALEPPVIGVPAIGEGKSFTMYMPNNDLDKVGGDPRRIAAIRKAKKLIKAKLCDSDLPFVYAWVYEDRGDDNRNAEVMCGLADRLYQFGRGVDLAWAWGEVTSFEELEERLTAYPGAIHRPSLQGNGIALRCPIEGSFTSLAKRFRAFAQRLRIEKQGQAQTQVFTKPSEPHFAPIAYDSPSVRRIFELRRSFGDSAFAVWPVDRVAELVTVLRDGANKRLQGALPMRGAEIERALVGRNSDGSHNNSSGRVRIVPLPSIGHVHADHAIRRVMVEVSAGCLLKAEDVFWAFSGLLAGGMTISSEDDDLSGGMRVHYGVEALPGYHRWRTITPVALPGVAARRRIDPTDQGALKTGDERSLECRRAAGALVQALRHASVRAKATSIRLQREPFDLAGVIADAFSDGTRFSRHRLWHAEVEFQTCVPGPLVVGDGRFCGLGIMAPVREAFSLGP